MSEKLIVFFRGSSQKRFDEIFNLNDFLDCDILEVAYDSKEDSLKDIIDVLKLPSYKEKIAICKSFGGKIALLSKIKFDKYFFLACPIIVGESTIEKVYDVKLKNLELKQIVLDESYFQNKDIIIFQGKKDREFIKKLSYSLHEKFNFELVEFDTDHGFKGLKKELGLAVNNCANNN